MRRVFDLVERFARSEAPVVVLGETGTGKELVARALHDAGTHARGPFVAMNCGALPAGLIESELFGHERGAFTGAVSSCTGAFEQAEGGTLFLDEIGELPLEQQARLLRVLETGTVRRVGAASERPYRARVVAATHRDLSGLAAVGRFRADLYHRLAVLFVELPPLRSRKADIAPVADELLRAMRASAPTAHVSAFALAGDAYARLEAHDWPGNVRELRNVLLRAVALREPGAVDPIAAVDLAIEAWPRSPAAGATSYARETAAPGDGWARPVRLSDHERTALASALADHGWNQSAAARTLGIARSTLREKMMRLGVRRAP